MIKISPILSASAAAVLLLGAASCNRRALEPSVTPHRLVAGDGPACMSVVFDGIEFSTKAQTQAEMAVNELYAAIYNEAGEREWADEVSGSISSSRTITGLEVGAKTIVAVANMKVDLPEHLEDFDRMTSTLSDNTRSSFVMTGRASAYADVKPEAVVIEMHRLVAKISFRGMIFVKWTSAPPKEFSFREVYVANVSKDALFSGEPLSAPSVNLRKGALTDDGALSSLTRSAFESWKGSGSAYNRQGVDFYVYPNSDPSLRTAIIIHTVFDGHDSYYPIVIDEDIRSNTQYVCGDVHIATDGMPSPADDFFSTKATYSYSVHDWTVKPLSDDDIRF